MTAMPKQTSDSKKHQGERSTKAQKPQAKQPGSKDGVITAVIFSFIFIALVFFVVSNLPTSQSSKTPTVTITTDPDSADIYTGTIHEGKTKWQSQDHQIGQQFTFTLKKSGYLDSTVTLTVPSKDSTYHYVLTPREITTVTITLKSTPSGARIYQRRQYVGTTEHQFSNLQPGREFKFTLVKQGYHDTTLTLVVPQRDSVFHCQLRRDPASLFGAVRIQTRPPGATVILNGDSVGVTPYSGDHSTGSYELTLARRGFKDWNTRFILTAAGHKIDQKLQCREGKLSVTIGPAEFTIWVGSRKYVNSLPDSVMCVGRHTIPIRHSKYGLWQEVVEIKENETKKLHINFEDTAYVFVSARHGDKPVDAYVIVDGDTIRDKGEAQKTPLRLPVRVGWRELKLYHKEYEFEVLQFNASQKGDEIEKSLHARPVKNDTLSPRRSGTGSIQN